MMEFYCDQKETLTHPTAWMKLNDEHKELFHGLASRNVLSHRKLKLFQYPMARTLLTYV